MGMGMGMGMGGVLYNQSQKSLTSYLIPKLSLAMLFAIANEMQVGALTAKQQFPVFPVSSATRRAFFQLQAYE